ncbi:MAG TPA: 50S ribosomal protein L11 methyltransferase [Gemmatimonadaceae bacterium]|nr:50S ribosomal protein L11 methyltransferase [Gemmatimonadaceae bacterium]
MSWISVRVRPGDVSEKDAIVASLVDGGAQSVQEDGDLLLTYLPSATDTAAIVRSIRQASGHAHVECAPAGDLDSHEGWLATVGIQRVGALTVAPPWLADEGATPAGTIVIDPAMAFGTGEHPSTRGVLELMQSVVRAGDRVADLGAGSAVLSIAAARLGASRVVAIEVDPDAIGNAQENVRRNGVDACVTVLEGDARTLLPLLAPVRVILANILSSMLLELSSTMLLALEDGGQAIVSGVLLSEREDFLRGMAGTGWRAEREHAEGEWLSVTLSAR